MTTQEEKAESGYWCPLEPHQFGKGRLQARGREPLLESSLYLPVKRFLEKLSFEVKGEICGCDLVALRDDELSAITRRQRAYKCRVRP